MLLFARADGNSSGSTASAATSVKRVYFITRRAGNQNISGRSSGKTEETMSCSFSRDLKAFVLFYLPPSSPSPMETDLDLLYRIVLKSAGNLCFIVPFGVQTSEAKAIKSKAEICS